MKSGLAMPAVLALLAAGATARAETNPFAEPPASGERQPRWGVNWNLGAGVARGDFSSLLEKPISGELNLFRQNGPWRWGLGLNWDSMMMRAPYDHEHEWALLKTYFSATRMLRTEGSFRPYLQVRAGLARLHPRSEIFNVQPIPEDYAIGNSTTKPVNGFSLGFVPGFEWNLNRSVAIDVSGAFSYYSVSEYDLSPVGLAPASSGSSFEGRLGVRWHPDNGYPSGPRPSVPEDSPRDAWGVSKNYGWAAVQVLGINWVSKGVNEYLRNGNFNQVSPRSWWANITDGFTYDDNEFRTNQYVHPFNGAAYFNSARSNGLNYWTSAAYGVFGAFYWECCGETHPMSINDLVSTGIGGIALGEMQYRLTSEILDNQATGSSRFFKELGSFFVDPVREFNRLVSGRAKTVHDNPTDPEDWRPEHGASLVMLGARTIGQGESISDNTKSYFNVGFDHAYGTPFDPVHRKPFDYMDVNLQLSFGEKVPLNLVRINGNIFEKPLGDEGTPNHVLALVQRFDYMNNTAFEFGGQSLGGALYSRFKLSPKWTLNTHVDGLALILGAVNSEYAAVADVGDRERLREYDYGPGLGASAQASLSLSGRPLLSLLYRYQWISVSNGSIFSKGQSSAGSDANHYIQAAGGRFLIPIHGRLALGADGYVFLRKSRYSQPGFNDIDQRNPQVRVFVAWNDVK